MPFFDFHCHPGLKPTFANQAMAPSVWNFISAKLAVFKNAEISINPLFNEVLNSQSCLSQLYNGNIKLLGIALHAPESAMGEGLLQKRLINTGAVPLIDSGRLELIKSGKHYFEFINEELARLRDTPAPQSLNGAKLLILNNAAQFKEDDNKTIYGFLLVEGLHCFYNDQFASDAEAEFVQNFEAFTDAHTILAINISHLEQNHFCNHAYGIQFITNKRFFPTGSGITARGVEVIKRMLDKNILVDVKHMSLRSRIQLYTLLKDPEDSGKYVAPIVCTHIGLTGLRMADRVKYIESTPVDVGDVYEVVYLKPESPYIEGVYFNCSSINLYDEDIESILLSDGLIGLSFDQRILGFADENVLRHVTTPNDVEYISEQEAKFFFGPNVASLPVWADDSRIWTTEKFENLDPSLNIELHPLFFINHVIHILTIAKNHPLIGLEKGMKKICLGTDYDGLINAIDNCKQADKIEDFRQFMLDKLPGLFKKANLGNDGINVPQLVDDIFENNGKNFVLNRLKSIGNEEQDKFVHVV